MLQDQKRRDKVGKLSCLFYFQPRHFKKYSNTSLKVNGSTIHCRREMFP